MPSLLELSHELLHCVFTEIDPADLAQLSASCQSLYSYIKGNKLLHKDLYVRRYDEPNAGRELDWEEETHNSVKLEKILESDDREVKREHIDFVSRQINSLIETANVTPDQSLNVQLLSDYFSDTANIDTLLCSSSLFSRGGTDLQRAASTCELQQASAKLHCLYGRPVDPVPSQRCSQHFAVTPFFTLRHVDLATSPSSNTRKQTRGIPAHTVARSKVYDLRQYTDATLWGPFKDDGSQEVDWEKVEAIMLVLGFNLNKFTERSGGRFAQVWDTPFVGATPKSFISPGPPAGPTKELDEEISVIRELSPSIDSLDPYGVTGTWMRVVCFLDYNDLYAFNFSSRIPDEELPIRLIRIKLQVTRIELPGSIDEDDDEGDVMDWSNFKGERLPVVHFRGSSRSLHASWDPNANSRIRGTVRQTPEGEIRWTTFSIFHGEERWRSEGIQVGGLRAARGVLGNWFDKRVHLFNASNEYFDVTNATQRDYDMHGPAGPTAFWKETDELADEKTSSSTY
ncbi:hypothetical protein LTR37_006653 [Vermiconidia calcicola]|uniref:Uncharacterized protein n=1 Tax=Vermiconidia calcicola TaxID=1690605 RepID=A0ACC3NHN1_9PEZI|nr:hypothetical protein LTR37_006653 [Vermiconidia calcicola]